MANARTKIFQILQFYVVTRGLTPFLIYFRKNSATLDFLHALSSSTLLSKKLMKSIYRGLVSLFSAYVTLFWNNRKVLVKLNARQSWVEPKSRWFTHPSPKSLNVLSCFEWKDEFNSNVMSVHNKNNICLNY